jgi:hypothetical protein
MTNEDETSRIAANVWWQPQPAMPALAESPAASGSFLLRKPSPFATLCFALISVTCLPFGIPAWIWANSQLRQIERGTMIDDGRGVLVIAKMLATFEIIAFISIVVVLLLASR